MTLRHRVEVPLHGGIQVCIIPVSDMDGVDMSHFVHVTVMSLWNKNRPKNMSRKDVIVQVTLSGGIQVCVIRLSDMDEVDMSRFVHVTVISLCNKNLPKNMARKESYKRSLDLVAFLCVLFGVRI